MVVGFPGQEDVVQKAHVKLTAVPIPKTKLVNRWQASMVEGFPDQEVVHRLMSVKRNVNQTLKTQSVKNMQDNMEDFPVPEDVAM